jgi:hypothetical protein
MVTRVVINLVFLREKKFTKKNQQNNNNWANELTRDFFFQKKWYNSDGDDDYNWLLNYPRT